CAGAVLAVDGARLAFARRFAAETRIVLPVELAGPQDFGRGRREGDERRGEHREQDRHAKATPAGLRAHGRLLCPVPAHPRAGAGGSMVSSLPRTVPAAGLKGTAGRWRRASRALKRASLRLLRRASLAILTSLPTASGRREP